MKNLSAQTHDAIRIGTLARQTGCTVPTIRYYEQVGLIPPAARRATGHRVYDPKAVQVLGFIRRCRELGFTIEQIRALVSLTVSEGRDCAEARDIAKSHLDSVRAKMIELMTLERSLSRFVDVCTATCVGGPAPECTILKDLGLPDTGSMKQAGCCR
jgi:DNA-binding transcriptional MerR regulator